MTTQARFHVVGVTPFRKSTKLAFATLEAAKDAYVTARREHNDAALIGVFPNRNVCVVSFDCTSLRPGDLCKRIGHPLPGFAAITSRKAA